MKDCATGNIRFPVCLGKRWNVDEQKSMIPSFFVREFLVLSISIFLNFPEFY